MLYSPFDFFGPTRVIVVSEERLREAERQAKQEQIEAVDVRIEQLKKHKAELQSELKKLPAVKWRSVEHGAHLGSFQWYKSQKSSKKPANTNEKPEATELPVNTTNQLLIKSELMLPSNRGWPDSVCKLDFVTSDCLSLICPRSGSR